MHVAIPKERYPGESRVAVTPTGIGKLVALGMRVKVQSGLGEKAGFPDADYADAGAVVVSDRAAVFAGCKLVLRIRKPDTGDIESYPENVIHVSFLDPYNESELIGRLAEKGASVLSMEMIPRITLAQKMDALSSQANLAGYVAVIQAAAALPKIFPMMMTPAGTIAPARVFVIGAGVAGLQAIATARRLGARVSAFDTRAVVAEQVQSLGARFVRIDVGETGQTEQGYARALTEEQLEIQRREMKKAVAQSDVVITTALLFGRSAPRIVTLDMIEAMQPGSVIVDMAVEAGGNVAGSVAGETVDIGGVRIIGQDNLPGAVAHNASEMFSANLCSLVTEFFDRESGSFDLDGAGDIVRGCLVTHAGDILQPV